MSTIINIIRWAYVFTCTSAAAAGTYAAQLASIVWLHERFGTSSPRVSGYVGLVSFTLAFVAFLGGVAVLGVPTAFIMKRQGWSRPRHAKIGGCILATLIGVSLLTAALGWNGLALSLALPISGAVGGATFHALTRDA
ncbi:hypothetical protein [Brevundimonas sp.]|uniref:hypothetical protein n=1 Tax=Brevundimonas sp. TaxID=1871086 RepID=UPI002EDA0458